MKVNLDMFNACDLFMTYLTIRSSEMSLCYILPSYLLLSGIYFVLPSSDHQQTETNKSSEESTTTTTMDSVKLAEALKNIAYYLRAHKFNEYDRRYETHPEKAERRYFKEFPRPPLRSLHWEVHKFCEPSFYECVDYLDKKLKYTASRRGDDTVIVMKEQRWHLPNNSIQIMQIDEECKKQRRIDDEIADPFEGPLERYQWRATASYFMCWYTMKNTPDLEHLGETCDNFANCLDVDFGSNNHDKRADDSKSYSCALYSFCPDPCCPFKHITEMESCWESPENPCYSINNQGQRTCAFNLSQNTEFRDIILNRWNVSCGCRDHGHEWNSRYGICSDSDECVSKTHNCRKESEACVNLPGSYRCACKWGDIWSEDSEKCMESPALTLLKLGRTPETKKINESTGLLEKLKNMLLKRNSALSCHLQYSLRFQISIEIFVLYSYFHNQF